MKNKWKLQNMTLNGEGGVVLMFEYTKWYYKG